MKYFFSKQYLGFSLVVDLVAFFTCKPVSSKCFLHLLTLRGKFIFADSSVQRNFEVLETMYCATERWKVVIFVQHNFKIFNALRYKAKFTLQLSPPKICILWSFFYVQRNAAALGIHRRGHERVIRTEQIKD